MSRGLGPEERKNCIKNFNLLFTEADLETVNNATSDSFSDEQMNNEQHSQDEDDSLDSDEEDENDMDQSKEEQLPAE